MIKVSRSLPDVSVLRGGSKDFRLSLQEGLEVLKSLTKIGYRPLDVLVEANGNWTLHGKPTEAHEVFNRSHTVIDTTRMQGEDYQSLAQRMGVPLLFSQDEKVRMDREDLYRVLRQQGFKVPETAVIRANSPLETNQLHTIWGKYHIPLMLRPLTPRKDSPSKLITSFQDLEKTVEFYRQQGVDMHVLTYHKVPTSSIAVIPNFRGEHLYTPLWVETFAGVKNIPNKDSPMQTYTRAPEYRKEQMKNFVTRVYEALDLSGPVCIDVIPGNDGYVVVNVNTTPSLRKEGRFMQSLQTTGVDVGQYIHSYIQNEHAR